MDLLTKEVSATYNEKYNSEPAYIRYSFTIDEEDFTPELGEKTQKITKDLQEKYNMSWDKFMGVCCSNHKTTSIGFDAELGLVVSFNTIDKKEIESLFENVLILRFPTKAVNISAIVRKEPNYLVEIEK